MTKIKCKILETINSMPERIPHADETETRCTPVCFSRERNKQDVSLKR